MQNDTIRKSTIFCIKLPYIIFESFIVILKFVKSNPPITTPIAGINTSFTSDVTIFPNAPPIITPTAKSITFPLAINFLNSLNIIFLLIL